MMQNELADLLVQAPDIVARSLLGSHLVRSIDGTTIACMIVETEAYHQSDAASHSFNGRTPRSEVMFGPSGHLYVYFTYGMHYCCNIVTGPEGEGSAVLIRAVEPLGDTTALSKRRGDRQGINLTNGPAKLCQALDISKPLNGHDLRETPLQLVLQPPLQDDHIVQTTRIGISRAQDTPWRFYIRDNQYVSKR